MPGSITAGACLHLKSKDGTTHLHIVLNDPQPYGNYSSTIGVVSLSSTIKADTTVILKTGDHAFINRETYVVYAWAKVIEAEKIEVALRKDVTIRHKEDCSPEVLKKVREGVFVSPFTTPAIKEYCRSKF